MRHQGGGKGEGGREGSCGGVEREREGALQREIYSCVS